MKTLFLSFILILSFAFRSCEEVKPVDRTIKGVKTSVAAFVDFFPEGRADSAVMIHNVTELRRVFGNSGNAASRNVTQFFLNGGKEAWVVRVMGTGAVLVGDSVRKTGMFALDHVDGFNVLCFPRPSDSSEANTLMKAGGSYCGRRRALLVIDVPKNLSQVGGIVDWVSSFTWEEQKNVALYYPGIITPGEPEGLGVAGTVAGIFARTDSAVGVWSAPAGPGAMVMNVTGCEHDLSTQDVSDLNDVGVNPLLRLPSGERLVWGAKTLSEDADSKYISVRRLSLYIEESIYRGAQWADFETDGDSLWAQVRLHVNDFMQSLYLKGALIGSKPSEAYFVHCDRQVMTQQDIDNRILNVQVGFAALKRGEFIIITIHRKLQ